MTGASSMTLLHQARRTRRAPLGLLLGLLLPGTASQAQDTTPWQEIEIVVFSHEDRASQVSERPLADPGQLGWLPRLSELRAPGSNLVFPFSQPLVDEAMSQGGVTPAASPAPPGPALVDAAPAYGPQPAPQATRSFRLLDINRDPYLALGAAQSLLAQDVRRIEDSFEHRVLWHATWRQPRLTPGQTRAVLVQGGEQHGARHELEGSLRLTDSGGRAQLELQLWFSSFVPGFAIDGTDWQLPELPALVSEQQDPEAAMAAGSWMISSSWLLRDSRLLTEDAFHYIDNPAIGVLVQVRPYTLPPLPLPGGSEDF